MSAATAPATLGRYEIRGELGSGAMALVYDGWDPVIGRRAAIKTIRRDQLAGAEADEVVARFKREAQAAGRLSHPNIVAVYEYGEDAGVAYIAMEFVTGQELKSYFDRRERFPMPQVVRIMTELLGALDAAHRRGIVHRDVKPGNIYLLEDGTVKVADFGIARIESSDLTQAGMVLGTPSYMSPEQFMGHPLDGRSDLFSAAVILYQFLTGEKPFAGNMASTIMHKVLREEPPAPSLLNMQIPAAFDEVLRRALAKQPGERYQSGLEFAAAIQAAASGAPLPAPAGQAPPTDRTARAATGSQTAATSAFAPKRRTALVAIVSLGLVAAAVGVGVLLAKKLKPAGVAAPTKPPVASAPIAAPQPKPFDPINALDRVFEARDRDHAVSVVTQKPRIRIGKENLRFAVGSAKGGYLYVLMVGTDRRHFNLLFPNAIDANNQLKPDVEVEFPRRGWSMTAAGPKGTNHFIAIVSQNPRDFSEAGLRKGDPFSEFPAEAAAAAAARAGSAPVFAGKPVCPAPGPCAAGYGAATFSIEEID